MQKKREGKKAPRMAYHIHFIIPDAYVYCSTVWQCLNTFSNIHYYTEYRHREVSLFYKLFQRVILKFPSKRNRYSEKFFVCIPFVRLFSILFFFSCLPKLGGHKFSVDYVYEICSTKCVNLNRIMCVFGRYDLNHFCTKRKNSIRFLSKCGYFLCDVCTWNDEMAASKSCRNHVNFETFSVGTESDMKSWTHKQKFYNRGNIDRQPN